MQEDDFALALRLQAEWEEQCSGDDKEDDKWDISSYKSQVTSSGAPLSIVDPQWELLDPNPDARAMFLEFNDKYFWGKLSMVEVRWSPRMTLCAGVCCYEGRGGLCSIRLSKPLLQLRPRKDLVETLLHEMIHAYLFVTQNNKDRDGHGPEFCKHMNRINKETGSHITIYHSFHDEVDNYRQDWWRCDGPCQKRPPYYGYVKRAMNRAPSARDPWWPDHQRTCGGAYHKVKEPDGYGEKKKKKTEEKTDSKPAPSTSTGSKDIRDLFKKLPKNEQTSTSSKTSEQSGNHSAEMKGDTETASRSSRFFGGGQILGTKEPKTNPPGIIVRRIPGIGIIRNERPSQCGSSSNCDTNKDQVLAKSTFSADNSVDSEGTETQANGRKRSHQFVDISDDEDFLPSKPKPSTKLRRVNSNELKSGTLDKYLMPGSSVSVSGFTSVCNRTSSSKDAAPTSLAADRNRRAHHLDSSSDSEAEPGEQKSLMSVLKKKQANSEVNTVSKNTTSSVSSESTLGIHQDSQQTTVECPVCGNHVPQENINTHLDSCLS